MRFLRLLLFRWGIGAFAPAPAARTFTVPLESRTFTVPLESREFTV